MEQVNHVYDRYDNSYFRFYENLEFYDRVKCFQKFIFATYANSAEFSQVLHDHISYRYEILEVIGKGSFGQVIKALDHLTKKHVAIKIIRNKKRFHHQALVEVRILDHLRKKDRDATHNVIHMLDYFYFRNHLCISFELMR